MSDKLKSSDEIAPNEITALLGSGTRFEGKLIFEGVVRIDGDFEGEIFTRDTVILGRDSHVKANIHADSVVVAGQFEGNIFATHKVEIQKDGHVRGGVQAPVFKIIEGGLFDGQTNMLPKE